MHNRVVPSGHHIGGAPIPVPSPTTAASSRGRSARSMIAGLSTRTCIPAWSAAMMRSLLPPLRPEKMTTPPRRFVPHAVEKIGTGMHVEPPIGAALRPLVVFGDTAQVVDLVGA